MEFVDQTIRILRLGFWLFLAYIIFSIILGQFMTFSANDMYAQTGAIVLLILVTIALIARVYFSGQFGIQENQTYQVKSTFDKTIIVLSVVLLVLFCADKWLKPKPTEELEDETHG
jgi:surface polysaccharide O-acyltransferase-like enzyme